MSDELKNCPFCGGEASQIAARQLCDGTYYPAACGCRKCGIWRYGESDYGHGGFATEEDRERSMKQAITAWNTRADDAPISENPASSLKESTEDTQVLTDSRERLLDYIAREINTTLRNKGRLHDPNFWYANIVSWLDRQAAITDREASERHKKFCAWCEQVTDGRIAELTAEVEKQRQRANDAERGALSDEWYVARDRYEDDVAALTAERERYRDNMLAQTRRVSELTEERDKLLRERNVAIGKAIYLERSAAEELAKLLGENDTIEVYDDKIHGKRRLVTGTQRKLEKQIAEMQEAIDAMGNGQFYAMYEELRAEVDNLRKRNDNQADTIRRLRAEFDAALDDLARAVEDKRSHPF